jgi:DNA mismatch repair ATPase MutS
LQNGLFILSTHLYEIGEDLKQLPSISFKYFETKLIDNELFFSYQLKDGVSEDRMGYLILQKEGVTSLLEKIGEQKDPNNKHPSTQNKNNVNKKQHRNNINNKQKQTTKHA